MSRVKDLTLADLGRKSIWRNTLIFDLLHRIGFVEKVGTGIRAEASVTRDRGSPLGPSPPTPPGIRVRTMAVR